MTEQEITKITEQWSHCGLLNGLAGKTHKAITAMCLQKQMKLNEKFNADHMFKRVSIPVIRRILGAIGAVGRNRLSEYCDDHEVKTHILRNKFCPPNTDGKEGVYSLSREAEYTADFIQRVTREIKELIAGREDDVIFHGIVLLPGKKVAFLYN